MKCKQKDCKDCVHFINIRTHPLFHDFVIKGEDGKMVEFEGCMFHLQTLFLRQIWVRLIGNESAIESHRNVTKQVMNNLALEIGRVTKNVVAAREQRVLEIEDK